MAEDNQSQPIDFRSLALLVILLSGASLLPWALRSSRPAEHGTLPNTALGDQVVPARLWQDPFQVTLDYATNHEMLIRQAPSNGDAWIPKATIRRFFSFIELSSQIVRHWRPQKYSTSASPVVILEVMVQGGAYAEDCEQRHRARYTVISALSQAGYAPWDPDHIV